MSSTIRNNGFFRDDNVASKYKLGMMALLVGGSYTEAIRPSGEKCFLSSVGQAKNQRINMIGFDFGGIESLGNNAIKGLCKTLATTQKLTENIDNILDGKLDDEEVLTICKQELEQRYILNPEGVKAKWSSKQGTIPIREKVEKYTETARIHDAVTFNPQIMGFVDELIKTGDKIYAGIALTSTNESKPNTK